MAITNTEERALVRDIGSIGSICGTPRAGSGIWGSVGEPIPIVGSDPDAGSSIEGLLLGTDPGDMGESFNIAPATAISRGPETLLGRLSQVYLGEKPSVSTSLLEPNVPKYDHLNSLSYSLKLTSGLLGSALTGASRLAALSALRHGAHPQLDPVGVAVFIWSVLLGLHEDPSFSVYNYFKGAKMTSDSHLDSLVVDNLYYHGIGVSQWDRTPPLAPFINFLVYLGSATIKIDQALQQLHSAAQKPQQGYDAIQKILEVMGTGRSSEVASLLILSQPQVVDLLTKQRKPYPEVDYIWTRVGDAVIPRYPHLMRKFRSQLPGAITFPEEILKPLLPSSLSYFLEVLEHGKAHNLRKVYSAKLMAMVILHLHTTWTRIGPLGWFSLFNKNSTKLLATACLCYFIYLTSRTVGTVDAGFPGYEVFQVPPVSKLKLLMVKEIVSNASYLPQMYLAQTVASDLLVRVASLEIELLSYYRGLLTEVYLQIVQFNIQLVVNSALFVASQPGHLNHDLAVKLVRTVILTLLIESWKMWHFLFTLVKTAVEVSPSLEPAAVDVLTAMTDDPKVPMWEEMTTWLTEHEGA